MAEKFGLYWWRPGDGKINLGDAISPLVLAHVTGRQIVHAGPQRCDGIAIGSVFTKRIAKTENREWPLFVWGSGTLQPKPCRLGRLSVVLAALRGPHTAGQIAGCPDLPFGDPGLFVPEIWPASATPSGRIGLIPHHALLGREEVAQLAAALGDVAVIDFTDPDIAATLQVLSECRLIVSSSLHGLVIADAYGIPSLFWNEGGERNEWKFRDYYAGAGREDYHALPAARIIEIAAGGKVADLPFSCLPAAARDTRLADLRRAAAAMPAGTR
ncbi:polysaccharide pyruvyl transferase family protein [Rhodobacter sp.]